MAPTSTAPEGAAGAPGTGAHDERGDALLARLSGAAVLVLVLAFLAGAPAAPCALTAGLGLVAVRRRLWTAHLSPRLIGTLLVVFGAGGLLAELLRTGEHLGGASPWALAGLGALLSSFGTNLAAVLLLEPAASSGALRAGLLVGVNLGVGFTPVASLATVLWADSLRRLGVAVPWRAYLRLAIPLSMAFLALTPLLARR